MKRIIIIAFGAMLLCASPLFGQGTFTYDQQSSTDEFAWPYGAGSDMLGLFPLGQSFTPLYSGIDFIRLNFNDPNPHDGAGAPIYLNLRGNSFSGTILGTTATVTMPDGFDGTQSFFFPTTISLTPGTTYYFEIVQESHNAWNIANGSYDYPGGTAYALGRPVGGADLWFREGLYTVPEPSPLALAALAAATLTYTRRKR